MCRRWFIRKQSPCVISNPRLPAPLPSVLLSCPVLCPPASGISVHPRETGARWTLLHLRLHGCTFTCSNSGRACRGTPKSPTRTWTSRALRLWSLGASEPLSKTLTPQISHAQPSIAKSTWAISSSATKLGVCLPQSSMPNAQETRGHSQPCDLTELRWV